MVELLAPVGDYETLASAIKAGADSVYFGIEWINMRSSSARNFKLSELKKVMKQLRDSGIKGYLTLNTVIFDHELGRVKAILKEVKKAKVDAVIVADMAVIQMCYDAGIEVHVSTQLSVANYESIKFFSKFSPRIVLARECTLDQIKSMKKKIKKDGLKFKGREIELETFVHGSLCVAYSGRCFMSQYHNRLSANRGQCLQECRRQYNVVDVEDPRREFILEGEYLMSPKDLCALPILDKLIDVGINVFKIEGRAKGAEYVYKVTKAYREAIDLIDKGKFTSKEKLRLVKELEKVFNRGFSDNFYLGVPTNDSWTKYYGSTAKTRKEKIGFVTNYYNKLGVVAIKVEQNPFNEGDKICFIGQTTGYLEETVKEILLEGDKIKIAKKGDEVSVKISEKVRENDKVFVVKEIDLDIPEEDIKSQLRKVGVHKPFKDIKKKGMD
ncbi:U32 family peptidase [Candidatus Woesearchaeota archaeon]|nr:U32 family peptidase [Candidatus Woesearchaeota archaeon]